MLRRSADSYGDREWNLLSVSTCADVDNRLAKSGNACIGRAGDTAAEAATCVAKRPMQDLPNAAESQDRSAAPSRPEGTADRSITLHPKD